MDMTLFLSIGSFLMILGLLVLFRVKNNRFEVRPADIIVAVVPVIFFLLVSGKLQKFEIGEGGVKIEAAFVEASTSVIASQVTELTGLPSEPIEIETKRGVEEIPRLIKRKTEGLLFRLGHGGYYGTAIQQYLEKLTKEPFLQFIIMENPDGTFFGMANARKLAALFETRYPPYRPEDFATWLNRGNGQALKRLPGFVGLAQALSEQTDKRQALQNMETLDMATLPVVEAKNRFVGITDRSRLTASLLLDLANNLEKK